MADELEQTSQSPSAAAEAQSEIQEYLEVSHQRHKLFPRAAVVGLVAGSIAVLFRILLASADSLRNLLIHRAYAALMLGWVFPMIFSDGGSFIAVWLVFRYAPETSGSGIPHLKAVLHRLRELSWMRVLVVKMASGVLAIGSGLALGREGPTVQIGGAVGDGMGRQFKVSLSDRL